MGPILEIREGCSDDELDEEDRAIVGEQKGRLVRTPIAFKV